MRQVYPNELTHYGILGQKWGVRRYQNPDGTLTEAGKRRYGTVENLESGRTKRQARKYEAEKKAAIRSGSVKEVSKYSKDLTSDELAQAIQRINTEQTLMNLRAKEISAGEAIVTSTLRKADSLGKAYNVGAQVFNMLSKNAKLPIYGDQSNNKKKELSLDDQKKLYELEKQKKADERVEEVKKLIRTKDADYLEKHANDFTAEELSMIDSRNRAYDKVFGKKAAKDNGSGTNGSNEKQNTGGSKKNQNKDGSKEQTSGESEAPRNTSEKDLPGGTDFTKDKKNSGETEKAFESPAISTAKTVADLTTKASKFIKDVKNSGALITSIPTKTGSAWVKDNLENETPFSRFKTTSLSDSGATVDFKGVVFTKETSSSGVYRDAYNTYMNQHPNSEASYDDFVRWQRGK